MNCSETNRSASSVTGETYHINHKVNCDENKTKERCIQENLHKHYSRMGRNDLLENMSVSLVY